MGPLSSTPKCIYEHLLLLKFPFLATPFLTITTTTPPPNPNLIFSLSIKPLNHHPSLNSKPISFKRRRILNPFNSLQSNGYPNLQPDPETSVQDLRVPNHWLLPSKAREESDWLRITLHKWLDEEYCPEETNVEISRVAAKSYYESLLDKETDLGEILLKMVRDLESISYKDSFHGAFSSANAAVNLISQRIELLGDTY